MITPADGVVPEGMPEDLERVHAALDARDEPAPEALLERILASRAAGERVIVPADHSPPHRMRTRIVRGAIAASIGFVAFAMWSRLSRPQPIAPSSIGTMTFGSFMFDGLDLGTPAAASQVQGNPGASYDSITLDVMRLHPLRLRYVSRVLVDGTHPARIPDTISVTLDRSSLTGTPWIATTTTTQAQGSVRESRADSAILNAATLRPQSYSMVISRTDGPQQSFRIVFGPDRTLVHREIREVHRRASTGAGAPSFDTTTTASDTVHAAAYNFWPGMGLGTGGLVANVMATPIGRGWKRSVILAVRTKTTAATELAVVGEATFDLANEKVDCWKAVMRGSPGYTMLIRKSDGLLVSISGAQTASGKTYGGELALISER